MPEFLSAGNLRFILDMRNDNSEWTVNSSIKLRIFSELRVAFGERIVMGRNMFLS